MNLAPTISTCWFTSDLQLKLIGLASEWYPNEVGGILSGYISGEEAIITEVVGPGPNAIHRRNLFSPDHQFHIREMMRIYELSNGAHTYLGDWHSHPDGHASLSALDKLTLQAIADSTTARCERPLMILLSGTRKFWDIHAFTLNQQATDAKHKHIDVVVRKYQV